MGTLAQIDTQSEVARPRLRKRLRQKLTKPRTFLALGRLPGLRIDGDARNRPASQTLQTRPNVPLPPDHSDAKWSEYLPSRQPVSEASKITGTIIPEFSHLAVNHETPRNSGETVLRQGPASSAAIKRRCPKTPIRYIGYLEGLSLPRPPNAFGSEKRFGMDLLADQYRALLEARSPVYTPSCHSEPPMPEVGSPTSDGTLVAFDDETAYFEPASFKPTPQSPTGCDQRPTPSPSVAPDKLSFQICLDLLTHDLAAGLRMSRPSRSSPEASALQVWVMIEAYERLREQLLGAQPLRHDEHEALDEVLGLWLRALWSTYDQMAERARFTNEKQRGLT